jgi:hypothetical protein
MSTKRPRAKDDHYRRIARKRVDDSRAKCSSGKFAYRLRADAEKVCAVMRAKNNSTTLGVYRCDECGRFHVGRSKWRAQ